MDKFKLCSQAMILIGGETISAFDEGTVESNTAAELWDTVKEGMFGYRWRFAVKQVQLTRRETAPLMRWDSAYDYPADVETVTGVLINEQLVPFDRLSDEIHLDALETDTVIAECVVIPPIALWPGWFNQLVVTKLASVFAMPVTEDVAKAQYYENEFSKQFSQARLIDSQGASARRMPVGRYRRIHGGAP